MRNAPKQIPILLGNLRQEIIAERAALRRKMRQGDEFNVFFLTGRKRKVGSWLFLSDLAPGRIDLERPFLIRSGARAAAVRKGGYWDEQDIEGTP